MAFLEAVYRNAVWLSVPALLVAAVLLVVCIVSLVKLGDAARIANLPLAEAQPVPLDGETEVVLALEGPRLSERFSGLAFELVSPEGKSLPASTAWFHMRRSGVSTVRMELAVFRPEGPGAHLLRVKNLGPARKEDAAHRVVLSRPQLARTIALILGIVLSAGLAIGSIVLFVLRVTGKADPW